MRAYERKVNQLKDLIIRKYKSAYDKSKEMDIDISSMTYLPEPDVFNVMYTEHMSVILDRVNKIIDENKDKLKNPTCATCVHLQVCQGATAVQGHGAVQRMREAGYQSRRP